MRFCCRQMMYAVEKGMIRCISLKGHYNISSPAEVYMYPQDDSLPIRVRFCPYCGTKTDLVDFDNDPEELKAEYERIRGIQEGEE